MSLITSASTGFIEVAVGAQPQMGRPHRGEVRQKKRVIEAECVGLVNSSSPVRLDRSGGQRPNVHAAVADTIRRSQTQPDGYSHSGPWHRKTFLASAARTDSD